MINKIKKSMAYLLCSSSTKPEQNLVTNIWDKQKHVQIWFSLNHSTFSIYTSFQIS